MPTPPVDFNDFQTEIASALLNESALSLHCKNASRASSPNADFNAAPMRTHKSRSQSGGTNASARFAFSKSAIIRVQILQEAQRAGVGLRKHSGSVAVFFHPVIGRRRAYFQY
jgi:hypothetical protein